MENDRPELNDSAYSGPLTAAELADYNAQRTGHWVIGAHGALRQPMAAEACTDFGAASANRRKWPMLIAIPAYCALVVAFFVMGWVIFAWPSGDTAKTLALLIVAPIALVIAVALLARWLH